MKNNELFEVFPWNKNLETGIEIVDSQHKELVKLLNLLATHIAMQSEETIVNEVLDRLAAYADYHFTTEESVWREYLEEDESFSSHQKTHNSFIQKIEHFLQDKENKTEHEIMETILRFLISWLAMHILDSDKRMAIIVQEMEKGLTLEVAKERAELKMSGAHGLLIATVFEMYESVSARTLQLLKERTERMRLSEELKKNQENEKNFNDAVMNAVPGVVALYNKQGELVRWNRGHTTELGYKDSELKNKNIFTFVPSHEHEKVKKAISLAKELGHVELEQDVITKDGIKSSYLINGTNVKIQDQNYLLITGVNVSSLKQTEDNLREALRGIITSISKAMEARDPYTAGHQSRVAKISVAIGKEMGMNEYQLEGLYLGASIHDIGKLSIPAELLAKPTRLSDIEYSMIKTHAEAGANIIKDVKFPWPILEIVSQHHERLDGSGYPLGIRGEQMSLEGKIVAVADVFEAISSHRPYRPSLGIDVAVEELKSNSGKFYDPEVVNALLTVLEKDPQVLEL